MQQIEMTAAQAQVIAAWSEQGESFVRLVVYSVPPSYARQWQAGDVLVTQGDAHLHVDAAGAMKDIVPPVLTDLTGVTRS